MARFDIFDTIADLRQTGAPFCVATVMRTADATSAKAGAKAAITEDGEILGHLGGACVGRAVRQAATEAIRTGEPRVIRVKPSDKVVSMTDADGAQLYKSGCPSGGTVDLLIEPYAHPARLAIFGATPIARAIAAHAGLAGFRVAVSEALENPPEGAARFDAEELASFTQS
ncbi:MAG: XdhC family protein, partial [Pseudomonadota bacterium]